MFRARILSLCHYTDIAPEYWHNGRVDLSDPTQSLIPSLDGAVLGVLAGTEGALSVTAIKRLARRGSRAGLSLALDRLTFHGLVIAEPANRGYMYRLNRHHVLTEAVLSAASARAELLTRMRDGLTSWEPPPVHVCVFGSFARSDGGPDSDIDVLVVTSDGVDRHAEWWTSQLTTWADNVLSWSGNRVELLSMSLSELAHAARAEEPVLDSIRNDGVVLLGPAPSETIASAVRVGKKESNR